MIEFKQVSKSYNNSIAPAVNAINLTVPSGALCVLIGPSGCGKTTTLRLVNRMIEASGGRIEIDSENITQSRREDLRKRIGYVIQSIGLFPHMTVEENIGIVPRLLKWEKERRAERAAELLKIIGLDPAEYCAKYPHELSGGEAQRIGVARALAASQNILLMDEPFGAVDPLRRVELQREFIELQRKLKKTVLFVTHDLDEAIRLADLVVVMKDGKIVQSDTPERLLASPKNRFVRDFIGEDRALKRLSCFLTEDYMRDAHTCGASGIDTITIIPAGAVKKPNNPPSSSRRAPAGTGKSKRGARNVYWVTDKRNRVRGMVRIIDGKPVHVNIPAHALTLRATNSLKEALSRALGLGISAVPIVDDADGVIGEVRLADIERVNQTGLKY